MDIDTYDDIDIDDDDEFDTGIAGFEIAYGTGNKKAIRRTAKYRYHIKQKLDSLHEKRFINRQIDTLSDFWDR